MSLAQSPPCAPKARRSANARFAGTWFGPLLIQVRTVLAFFVRPLAIIRGYKRENLQSDLVAAMTVAVVTVPQAMAYALIAELPPQFGLYSAIVGAIVGALWGSSHQLQTGPTNTTSLLVLSVLLSVASPGTPEYIAAAGVMALMVGVVRLGMLVNFVSDSVIVGFTAGAGTLILINQIRSLLRLSIPSAPGLWETIPSIITHLPETHMPSVLVGLGTIAAIVISRKVNRKLPGPLIGMVVAAIAVGLLGLDGYGVRVVGELPSGLPPLASLSSFDLDLAGKLVTGSIAVAAIGLVEAMSIARSIASQTGQRLDSNQEFVGQGLSNIACAFFSGYTCAGSFTRSAVNYEAGAKTALSSVFSSIFVLLAMFVLAPVAAYVPLAALAGVLILTAIGLVDGKEMARIWQSGSADRAIMVITLLATLVLPLQFAVITGIAVSLIYYLIRTSTPRVRTVLPEKDFRHFAYQPENASCPQLGVVEILGDLYFGAVNHVEDCIQANLKENPDQRYLLLRMHNVDHCDISGIHALEAIVRTYRDRGGDVYFVRVRQPVLEVIEMSGFYAVLGEDHFLDPDESIGHLFYRVLDPAICIYECPIRAFKECQNLPKRNYVEDVRLDTDVDLDSVPTVTARELWQERGVEADLQVIDVREPREFNRGHIPGACSRPLPALLPDLEQLSHSDPIVLVCRGGRRSTRATALLCERGYENVRVLQGGMIAWERAQLLEAIE